MISTLRALAVAVTALGTLAMPARAEPPRAVVELFTSQGCSSCPPADALALELAARPGIVVLTMPVDYWDYLGWKDTLALPGFSARQRAYAHLRGDRQVFTPQIVVNGARAGIGSNRAQVEAALQGEDGGSALPVMVSASQAGGTVAIEVNGAAEHQATGVWVLPVRRLQSVEIGRGENEGRKVTYANVARGIVRIGEWKGGQARFEVPLATAKGDGDGYIVLLQMAVKTKPGVILGAFKSPGL